MKYHIIADAISAVKSIPQIESSLRESGLDFTLVRAVEGEYPCLGASHLTLELLPLELEIICT